MLQSGDVVEHKFLRISRFVILIFVVYIPKGAGVLWTTFFEYPLIFGIHMYKLIPYFHKKCTVWLRRSRTYTVVSTLKDTWNSGTLIFESHVFHIRTQECNVILE
jgi:hypothetical protein